MHSINIFIIYAREDIDALKELKSQLIPVANHENLTIWYDGEILPGQHWDDEIKTQLGNANIILLLISKYFFASNYIQTNELNQALARHKAGEVLIVPIIVRACAWQDAFEVSKFQVLPFGGQPIFSKHWHDVDEAMTNVVAGVKRVVQQINGTLTIGTLMEKTQPIKINLSTESEDSNSIYRIDLEIIEMKLNILRKEMELNIAKIWLPQSGLFESKRISKDISTFQTELNSLNLNLKTLLQEKNSKKK